MSQWLNKGDVEVRLENRSDLEQIMRFFGVSIFLNNGLFSADSGLEHAWESAVTLSEQGRQLASALQGQGATEPERMIAFIALRLFTWHDFLIDPAASDFDKVLCYLNELHASESVRWPYVYGHEIYHKFNDQYQGNRTEFLEASEVDNLLQNTPQGVFQVGPLLSGPLGFLESQDWRFAPPTLRLPLWHCSDVGCGMLHFVQAHQHEWVGEVAYKQAFRFLRGNLGPRSEWSDSLAWRARGVPRSTDKVYADLGCVLADCFPGTEKSRVLEAILSSDDGIAIRDFLKTKKIRGPSAQISNGLSSEQQLQLLLIIRDGPLIRTLDDLIARRIIEIPPSEVRVARTYTYRPSGDLATKISALGLRSTEHSPVIQLYSQIWNTYERLGMLDDLSWRVKKGSSATTTHALMEYMRRVGPETAVRDLILSSKAVTTSISESLRFHPRNDEDDSQATKRLLWKLGFRVPRFEEDYAVFRNRISEFRAAAFRLPQQPKEDDRSQVRSSGVTLFVSVESFLEDLLSYNVWMMASDHLVTTRFKYQRQFALAEVSSLLGERLESGEEWISWSKKGANTIGTLAKQI